ncbi:MAG: aminoacyl-tRNA hydrolase [Verrucomicrobiaceae bacterium]|nr:MAG: aminoacyl-tRNA hydrolase [Verrucomicrobiaceae bacterium]
MSANLEGPTFRLIVGLGNPGREYRDTRHNIGFMILDRLAADARAEFRADKAWHAEIARSGDVFLCKPQTYMNRSGESVRALTQFFKIEPAQVLIIADDMALPLGKLRFRPSGSAGGQKGLRSVIDHLGTQDIPRLRVGIGEAKAGEAVDHVLGKFSSEERLAIEDALSRATEGVACAQRLGLQAAMNAYN